MEEARVGEGRALLRHSMGMMAKSKGDGLISDARLFNMLNLGIKG